MSHSTVETPRGAVHSFLATFRLHYACEPLPLTEQPQNCTGEVSMSAHWLSWSPISPSFLLAPTDTVYPSSSSLANALCLLQDQQVACNSL